MSLLAIGNLKVRMNHLKKIFTGLKSECTYLTFCNPWNLSKNELTADAIFWSSCSEYSFSASSSECHPSSSHSFCITTIFQPPLSFLHYKIMEFQGKIIHQVQISKRTHFLSKRFTPVEVDNLHIEVFKIAGSTKDLWASPYFKAKITPKKGADIDLKLPRKIIPHISRDTWAIKYSNHAIKLSFQ